MKLFNMTFLFLIISSFLALAGNVLNSRYIEYSLKKETLIFANDVFDQYRYSYDPSKKTVVIFGVSTSIYSFYSHGDGKIHKFSYVDILKNDVNVLRFTSILLDDVTQIEILLDFLNSKNVNFDLIIFENLKYFAPPRDNSGLYNLTLFHECIGYIINPSLDSSNMPKLCSELDWQLGNLSEEHSGNPCMKKYQYAIRAVYRMPSPKRIAVFDELLNCGEISGKEKEIQNFILKNYHYGYAEEVRKSFAHFDLIIDPDLKTGLNINGYMPDDLIFLNKYLNKFIEKYNYPRVLVIPSLSRLGEDMKELPLFKKSPQQVTILEMQDEIWNRSIKHGLKFKENFQDGAHYNNDIHQALAKKIKAELGGE